MKKLLFLMLFFVMIVSAQQLGTRYTWVGYIDVDSVGTIDTSFTGQQFEEVTFYSNSISFEAKIGAPDTASWNERKWLSVPVGSAIVFGYPTYIMRMELRSLSAGRVYYIGTKSIPQF